MSIKNTFSNNIININKFLEKIQINYEQDMKKLEKNLEKNIKKDILTKISKKYKIPINELEYCINNNEENDEKNNEQDSEKSIDDEGQILEVTKINNKTYYIDNKKKYIYKKVKKNKNKLDHVGYIKEDEFIFNTP